MPRTHFPNPANLGTTQELLDIQQTVRALADQLDRIERSAGKPRGEPRGVRPTATLQAITIGGVQQPFFSGDQLGPLCFETLDVEQQFFEQLHAREADAAGGQLEQLASPTLAPPYARPRTPHTLAGEDDDHSTPQRTATHASNMVLRVAEMVTMFHHSEVAAAASLGAASPLRVHEPHHLPGRALLNKHH